MPLTRQWKMNDFDRMLTTNMNPLYYDCVNLAKL